MPRLKLKLAAALLCAALCCAGCANKMYDGDREYEISLTDQLTFLMGGFIPEGEQEASVVPRDHRDYAGMAADMRAYLENNGDMHPLVRECITEILDLLEETYIDDLAMCEQAFAAIDYLQGVDRDYIRSRTETNDYMKLAVGSALYADRLTLSMWYKNVMGPTRLLNACISAAAGIDDFLDKAPNFSAAKYEEPDGESAFDAELELTISDGFINAYRRADAQIVEYYVKHDPARVARYYIYITKGLQSYETMRREMLEGEYSPNMSKQWLKTYRDILYYYIIPRLFDSIGSYDTAYRDSVNNTMSLLKLYNFLYDEGHCACHMDAYHFSEAHYAFKDDGIEQMEENLRNKLSSYGGGYDASIYEDDNILNLLMYAGFPPERYEELYFLHGMDLSAELAIRGKRRAYGDELTDRLLNDLQIARSGALLLPPVFMYAPEYRGIFTYTDGGLPDLQRDYRDDYATWSGLSGVMGFYSGAGLNRAQFGDTVGGYGIMALYKGLTGSDTVTYDLYRFVPPEWAEFLLEENPFLSYIVLPARQTFKAYLDARFQEFTPRREPAVYGLPELCRGHLISYHTIEPELLVYLTENELDYGDFTGKYSGEDINIRNFVSFFKIPREDFDALFGDGRTYAPYNAAAVYGEEKDAEYYFNLAYKPGYNVDFLNYREGRRPPTLTVPPGKMYTLPEPPFVPGFEFVEWNENSGGSGAGYAPLETLVMDPPADTAFYAVWKRMQFLLRYDMNGGPGEDIEEMVYYDDYFLALPAESLRPPVGMMLSTWNTEPDGTGATYYPDEEIRMPPEDLTLYAIWELVYYPVDYDIQGNVPYNPGGVEDGVYTPVSGYIVRGYPPPTQNVTYGEVYELHSQYGFNPPATGTDGTAYAFTGWSPGPDGDIYQPGDAFIMPANPVTFHAVWKQRFVLTFQQESADIIRTVFLEYYDTLEDDEFIIPSFEWHIPLAYMYGNIDPSRYVFDGWTVVGGEDDTVYREGDVFVVTGHATFEIAWAEIPPVMPEPEETPEILTE